MEKSVRQRLEAARIFRSLKFAGRRLAMRLVTVVTAIAAAALAVAAGVVSPSMTAVAHAQPGGQEATDPARSEARIALVIGNSKYDTAPLRNPVNDARAMTQALRGAGFDVLVHENVDYRQMRRAVVEFGDRLLAGGVGIFYYAGHGLQVAGRNYMVPVDAAIRTERDVEAEAVDVATVLAQMDAAKNRLNVVILDACRDNPYGRSFRSKARGLASIDAPSGTLIAYATAPGQVALDGEGENGVYTGELVKAIQVPGLRIEDVFKRTRLAVQAQTKGQQVSWESSSLVGEFTFTFSVTFKSAPSTPPPAPGAPAIIMPLGPVDYYNRGLEYGKKGQYDQAIKEFNQAIALDPNYGKAYVARGIAHFKSENGEKAGEDFAKACNIMDRDACTAVAEFFGGKSLF